MKKFLLISLLCISAVSVLAEKTSYCGLPIYARVGALEEGVPVYEYPQPDSRKVGEVSVFYHGLCSDVLIKNLGDWYLVDSWPGDGYVQANDVLVQTWYRGDGKYIIVAAKPKTYIYIETYDDNDDDGVVRSREYVARGTIITDQIVKEGSYYVLTTAHDYLFVHKDEVELVRRDELPYKALTYRSKSN